MCRDGALVGLLTIERLPASSPQERISGVMDASHRSCGLRSTTRACRSVSASGDPAFGSGPLATVVQDLLSVLIYRVIATAIV
ncbi:hypothetical protein [Lentzea terrae]|uniref:hypothetical protein n=1 Tax=Lentzea terrae TaxID=2200761 RepID=UPI0018E4EFFB|nr:hypothetical protein [Lentzea terrae]